MLARIRTTWRALTRRLTWERELDEELSLHVEMRAVDLIGSGTPPADAQRQARLELGSRESYKEQTRAAFGLRWFDELWQDLLYAGRQLRRSPGVTAVAVLSLALGIGANTAIFTLIESAMWRPLPVRQPEQLRVLSWVSKPDRYGVHLFGDAWPTGDGHTRYGSFPYPVYRELIEHNSVFESLFAVKEIGRITAVEGTNAEAVNCFLVSGEFYQGIGVVPAVGRAIGPEDDVRSTADTVAVISYDYWTRRFGRDPSVIGTKIVLNQVPATIVGVNPAYFTGIEPGTNPEIWAPLHVQPRIFPMRFAAGGSLIDDGKVWWLSLMGRAKAGVSDAQVQSFLDTTLQRKIDADFPGMREQLLPRFLAEPGARGLDYLPRHYGKPLLVLLALAGLVLLIACANVANLLLAQSAARQREISLRLALGAGRWRIVRQLLTEGVLLACLAGITGIVLGYWTRSGIPALLATSWRPSPFEAAFDPRVLLISIGITFATGILFSLAPAWQARRVEVNDALKDGSRATASLSRLRGGNLLVVVQVAVSLLLLVGAELFLKTLSNLRATPSGFNAERVLLFALDPPALRYPGDRTGGLFQRLQDRIGAIPGVRSATFSSIGMMARTRAILRVTPGGQETDAKESSLFNEVGSRFFETMGIPILRGRATDERDLPGALVAVVANREFGRYFFHEDNPLGKTFINSNLGVTTTYQIVGICADTRYGELRDAIKPIFYAYFPQDPHAGRVTFEVKMAGDEAGIIKQIRRAVGAIDADLAITDVRTQTEQIEDTLSQERLLASLAAAFGALALVLACIGIYGVMAYAVARRTSEIGIRVALGAEPRRVARMVLRETMLLAAAGLVIGVPAALFLSRFTQSFLYGLKPNDPSTLAAAVAMLTAAGALAGYLPARRAARVDPLTALRHE